MKKDEIQINVIGRTGSGKSTITKDLYDELSSLGFNVKVNDIDYGDNINSIQFLAERIEVLKKKVNSISIIQQQVNRESVT